MFLVGQEKLLELMRAPDMEQFQQRVIGACRLEPLDLAETRAYLAHRLQRAGWQGDPQLTGPAVLGIYRYSLGVPRHVNKICSRLLIYGSLEQKHELHSDDVLTVAAELRGEQLAPLGNEGTMRAQTDDGDGKPETGNSAPNVDDLAIRTISRPAHHAATAMNAPTMAAETQELLDGQASGPPALQTRSVEIHGPPAPDTPTATPASQPAGDARLQRLLRLPGLLYHASARAYTYLRQGATRSLPVVWQRISEARFTGHLNWPGNRAVLAGAAVAFAVSITGLGVYLVNNSDRHDALVMVQPEPALLPERVPFRTESLFETSAAMPGDATMGTSITAIAALQPLARKPYRDTRPDTGNLPSPAGPSEPERDPADVTPTSAVAADDSQAPETAPAEPARESLLSVSGPLDASREQPPPARVADAESPPAITQDTEPGVEPEDGTEPQAAAKAETDEARRFSAASLEPLAAVSAAAPAPPEDNRQQKISDLLALGREAHKDYRLLFPEDGSAYYYYHQVLSLEPDNREALHGMERIVQRYLALATAAMEREEMDKARRYVARGLRVQRDEERLVALRDSLRAPPPVSTESEPRPPTPAASVEEPPPVAEPAPPAGGVFSRIRAFFEAGQTTVEKTPLWEEDDEDF